MQTDVATEILETLHRAGEEDVGQDVESRIKHLPRTNPDFEATKLYGIVSGQLQAHLGEAVNEAVDSKELQFAHGDCVSPGAVDEVVARLAASPSFADVVQGARACLQRAGRLKNAACDVPPAAGAAAAVGGTTTKDERIHLHRNDMSSSDTEGEGMHAKKKALRMDDWVGTFCLSGGGGGRGFSPRIDVEAALGQLEAGLGSPGGSATSATEALGLLAEADPELFQFGNHWPPFLELARRALRSADPAVHAKAMSLHWVMYEKSMGMSAADMCEGVLDHARHYFAGTVHVLPFPAPNLRTEPSARGGGDCDTGVSLAGLGKPELARAARMARALHGMLATIHEAFQHLPEKRVWNLVSGFLSLFGDAATAAASATGPLVENGAAAATVANSEIRSAPLGVDVGSGGGSGGSSQEVLLPAHFLAIAGTVDDWLPGWLKTLPTGRLVRAVTDAGLVAAMVRRCAALQPQVSFLPRRLNRPRRAESALGAAAADLGHRPAAFRPSLSAVAAVVPPGDVIAPPATDLDRALLLQSVSFLGTIAAHCRGNPRPCPPTGDAAAAASPLAGANGNASPGAGCKSGPPVGGAVSGPGGEGELDMDLEQKQNQQGENVMQALAWCVAREPPPAAEPVGGRMAPRQPHCSRRAPPMSVRIVALGYVGQVARAAAGAASTPFTPAVIDVLFSPLAGGSGQWNGSGRSGGQAGGCGGGSGGGSRGYSWHGRFDGEENGGPLPLPVRMEEEKEEEEPALFFGALAKVAGVLLSSRGGSKGFFVDGPAGPGASRALLEIAHWAAELAKYACWRRRRSTGSGSGGPALREGKANGAPGVPGSASAWERRFRWLNRGDPERLAVEFACALTPIMAYTPKQRAAGWAALWRCDVPHALAALTACLDFSPAPKGSAFGRVEGGQRKNRSSAPTSLEGCNSGDGDERGSCGRSGDGGNSGGEPWKRYRDLRDRLLLSLVEWARDLAGVSYLRRVGLARPCASFLSRYLARRNLRPAGRDECADPGPLALAARLSLCAEGLEELLCADGGIADEVDAGLGRLEELMNLAELLPSHMAAGRPLLPQTPPPHALALAVGGINNGFGGGGEGGGVGDGRGCSSAGGHQRLSWMEVGGGSAPDLRCLDIACRFFCLSTALPNSGSAVGSVGAGALRAGRWLRWAVLRAAPGGALPDSGGLAPEEEVARSPEDVRVAALGLATSLASDLTVAVAMEARWSLADALAQQQPVEGAAMVAAVSSGRGATIGSGGIAGYGSRRGGGGDGDGDPEAMVSKSGPASNQARIYSRGGGRGGLMSAHISDVMVPLEPVGLGCARLVVSLTSLGGPNEERRNRMQRLRDVEVLACAPSACLRGDAAAAATAVGTAAAASTATVAAIAAADATGSISQHATGDLRGMAQVALFPEDSLSDEDWWSAARQCVSTVVEVLAKPRGPHTDEAFALLTTAAAKGPALPPDPTAAAPRAPEFAGANNRDSGTPSVPRSEGNVPGERPVVAAVAAAAVSAMENLLFSYACGLGLVDGSDRNRFGAGLRNTLAAAESVKSATTSPFFPFSFPPAYFPAGPAGEETRLDGRSCGCDWFTAVVFLASCSSDGGAASGMIRGASWQRFPGTAVAPPPPSLAGKLHAADGAGTEAAEVAAEASAAPAAPAAAAAAGVAVSGSTDHAAAVPVVGVPRAPRLPPVSTMSTTKARFLPPMTVTESRAADNEEEVEEITAAVVAGAGAGAGARAGVGAAAGASPSPPYVGAAAAAGASLGDPPLLLLAALAEEIVEEELPGVSEALSGVGWAVAPLAVRWIRQCMLCVVDWAGVVAYLALILLRGHDYQVYFVVALLRTAQPSIMDAASTGLYLHLGDLLAGGGGALDGFDLADALSYMEGLERRHRSRCLAATEAYLAQ